MKSASGSIGIIAMVILVMVIFTGCMKHPQVAEPQSKPPAGEKTTAGKIVVAKVNGTELFMDSLVKMMNRLPAKKDGPPETLEERRKRALDSLVLLELAYQRAKARGLGVDPSKIDLAISNFKENVGDEKEYNEYLSSHGLSEADLRAEVEKSLTIELIYAREVVDNVTVPEEELKREYEKEKNKLIQPEKVLVIDVFLSQLEGKAARKKAGELLALIKGKAGQDPWKLVLDGTFTVRRLALVRDKEKELYDAAKKLKPQGISGIIETPGGVHIVKLESYSPERVLTFDEAKPKIEALLKNAAQEKRTREWEEELKKDAKIEAIKIAQNGQNAESVQH